MVRGQAVTKPRRGAAVSKTRSIAAPIGGLNAVDALAQMPETDAIVLDNWFPQPSFVEIRNGYSLWKTGFPGAVETVMGYSNAAGEKLFGISGTAVYDATLQGAIGSSVVSGLTNARWEYTNVATAGGQFLYAANAVDKPLLYDGTNWTKIDGSSSPAITGVTTTKLRNPALWKNRVWFVEDGSMRAWYLPTASVGGAAAQFDLGPIFRLGGQLHVIMTASLTDGSTFDDYIAFMSTEGEIALYRGTDPATVGLFNIVGVYRLGKPFTRRCFFKMGTDTIIICSDGMVSLTKLISIGRYDTEKTTISYKILNLVNQAVQTYKNNFGWQGIVFPLGNKVIINVPLNTNAVQTQFVMNTVSEAWCTFSNWNANTFEVLGDSLYFGGSNFIALADTGLSDNSKNITATLKTAFSYFGTDQQKFFKMVRPIVSVNGTIHAALALNTDFADQPPISYPSYIPAVGPLWDVTFWDASQWASDITIQKEWQTIYGVGFSAALYMSAATMNIVIRLQSLDYVFGVGGVL